MAVNFSTITGAKTVLGSIANYVNRSDLPTANILLESESMICERLRVREMQAREVLTFALSTQTAALPTGFLDPIGYRPYELGCELLFVHEGDLDEVRTSAGVLSSGDPSRWTIIGETAYLDTLPDAAYSGYLHFYKRPTALSVSNETNWLTIRYPSLLRYACMAKAYEHMKDQKAAEYLQLTMGAIAEANATNELWRRNQLVLS